MKNIEKVVNTDVEDCATDFKTSNLSTEGHISRRRQLLLYMTKNADITLYTTGRSEKNLEQKWGMKNVCPWPVADPSLLSPGKPMGRGEAMDVCADTPSVGSWVAVVGSWVPLFSRGLMQVGLLLRESEGFLVRAPVRKDKYTHRYTNTSLERC